MCLIAVIQPSESSDSSAAMAPLTSAGFLATQFHESWRRSAAVRVGRQTTPMHSAKLCIATQRRRWRFSGRATGPHL